MVPKTVLEEKLYGIDDKPTDDFGRQCLLARIAALAWDDFADDVDACTACGLCRTRHIFVTDIFIAPMLKPFEMQNVMSISRRHTLFLIEDFFA